MRRTVAGLLCFVLAAICFSQAAPAQEKGPPEETFQKGVDLAMNKEYEAALDVWLPLLSVATGDLAPKVRKATALAYKKLGMMPEEWFHLTTYLELAAKEDLKAGAWLEKLDGKLQKGRKKVAVSCEPSGARLYMGNSESGFAYPCPLTWWFTPGQHKVHVVKDGFKPKTELIDVRERGNAGVHLVSLDSLTPPTPVLDKTGVEDVKGTPATSGIVKPVEPKRDYSTLGWLVAGSGAAIALTGGILQVTANVVNENLHDKYVDKDKYPDGDAAKALYDSDYEDKVKPKRTAAFVLYGIGGAAAIAGVVIMVVGDGAGDKKDSSISIAPLLLRGGAGASFGLEF